MDVEIFEPLGSNCEFGFVLQRIDNGIPSVFRWTSIQIDDLCHLLDADFADVFEDGNICPHTDSMVLDRHYMWAFHSALKSSDGQFTMEAGKLAKLFRIERLRLLQTIDIFRQRLRNGKVICVFSADGVLDDQVLALRGAIDRFAGHGDNGLMVVSGVGEGVECGALQILAPRTWRGGVKELAPWSQADDADYDNWIKLLSRVAEA